MKKILITGNAGMIGSVLANFFLKRGYKIIGIDNLSGGFFRNVNSKVKFYQIDICNDKQIKLIFQIEKPDYVIHCAAYAAEILSPFIRNYNYTNNIIGSINIINACINNNVKKIINFSSFATYGSGNPPFKETDIRNPKDCYGIAKLAVEMDLQEAYEHFGLRYSTVLPHNVISEYQNYYDRYRNAIAIWVRQCYLQEDITIYGDGTQTRAFSDCKYLCEPIEKLLENYDGEIFNIGSDNPITILEAANLVLKIGNGSNKILFLPQRKEVKNAYCSHDKAKEKLGFYDKTDLELVIKNMFNQIKTIPRPKEIPFMEYEIEKNMYSFWKKK